MKDYKITKEDFIQNKGYSSHYFFTHALYFFNNAKGVKIDFYRKKIILSSRRKRLVVRCHYKNRSRHYITILDKNNIELVTFRDTVKSDIMTKTIILLLKSQVASNGQLSDQH